MNYSRIITNIKLCISMTDEYNKISVKTFICQYFYNTITIHNHNQNKYDVIFN